MTEDTGFAPVPDEEPAPETALEEAVPAPAEDAEDDVAGGEVAEEPASDPAPPPLPDPDWLIDLRTQFPDSALLQFVEDVHRRLRNLGG